MPNRYSDTTPLPKKNSKRAKKAGKASEAQMDGPDRRPPGVQSFNDGVESASRRGGMTPPGVQSFDDGVSGRGR